MTLGAGDALGHDVNVVTRDAASGLPLFGNVDTLSDRSADNGVRTGERGANAHGDEQECWSQALDGCDRAIIVVLLIKRALTPRWCTASCWERVQGARQRDEKRGLTERPSRHPVEQP